MDTKNSKILLEVINDYEKKNDKFDRKEFDRIQILEVVFEAMNRVSNLKKIYHFDCWDKNGKLLGTKTIEALNEENATIIFKTKYPELGFDPPY